MAAPTLTTATPTEGWVGTTFTLRAEGTGIEPTAILRLRRSSLTYQATNVTVAGDGTWIQGTVTIPVTGQFPADYENVLMAVQVENAGPAIGQLLNWYKLRPNNNNAPLVVPRRAAILGDEEDIWEFLLGGGPKGLVVVVDA